MVLKLSSMNAAWGQRDWASRLKCVKSRWSRVVWPKADKYESNCYDMFCDLKRVNVWRENSWAALMSRSCRILCNQVPGLKQKMAWKIWSPRLGYGVWLYVLGTFPHHRPDRYTFNCQDTRRRAQLWAKDMLVRKASCFFMVNKAMCVRGFFSNTPTPVVFQ